jgi:hypothetical protein
MSIDKTKLILATLFLAGLLIEVLLFYALLAEHALSTRTAMSLINDTLNVYLIPLGVILGGIFGDRGPTHGPTSRLANVIAVVISCIWNLLFLIPSFIYCFTPEGTKDAAHSIFTLAPYANSLVAIALVWAFGSSSSGPHEDLEDVSKQTA